MDKVSWKIEILGNHISKGVVRLLVGRLVPQSTIERRLLLIDRVREQRTVMSLQQAQRHPLTNDVRLHTIASEDVLQLGC